MTRTRFGLSASLLVAFPALAQPHDGDIILEVRDGAIVTGAAPGGAFLPERVFGAVLGANSPNFTSNPGYDSQPGTFPPSSSVGFNIRRALRWWDDSDFDQFPPETIGITFGPLGPVLTPPTDVLVPGFTIGVGANGQWHKHLGYRLNPPADTGIYLLELELFSTAATIAPSLPFWLVFNQNDTLARHAAAVEWVRDTLAGTPCPADFNGDDVVNVQDFLAFLAAYAAGEPRADFTGDGQVNVQDVLAFLTAYASGCP